MADDKKKGKGRVVITNVRVTKETHEELRVLADMREQTMSEAISDLIRQAAPEVIEEVHRRRASKQRTSHKRVQTDD